MRRSSARFSSTLSSHYGGVRQVYDQAPFYAPGPYEAWLVEACLSRLGLSASHALADLGGGSGAFATKLKEHAGARWLSVIEPSAEMITGADTNPLVDEAVVADALSWAEGGSGDGGEKIGVNTASAERRFDRVLLKEMVHHISDDLRPHVFRQLRERRLTPEDGRVLIVTRPQREIDYPLWNAAYDVWAQNQPSEADLVQELREAGYGSVDVHLHSYPHEVPLDEWRRLVRGRFWSTFSNFTDAELEVGCAHIGARSDADGMLRFEDRLLLIDAAASNGQR